MGVGGGGGGVSGGDRDWRIKVRRLGWAGGGGKQKCKVTNMSHHRILVHSI